MFCKKCGNVLKEGEKFCRKCGNPVIIVPAQQKKTEQAPLPLKKSRKKKISIIILCILIIILIAAIMMGVWLLAKEITGLSKNKGEDSQKIVYQESQSDGTDKNLKISDTNTDGNTDQDKKKNETVTDETSSTTVDGEKEKKGTKKTIEKENKETEKNKESEKNKETQSERKTETELKKETETVIQTETETQSEIIHNYYLVTGEYTWEEANEYCKEHDGYLATITTKEEAKIVEETMAPADKIHVVWLGANDLNIDNEYKWINGEELSYSQWGKGEPNNEDKNEHYLVMYEVDDKWVWNDAPNDIEKYYKGKMGFLMEVETLKGEE